MQQFKRAEFNAPEELISRMLWPHVTAFPQSQLAGKPKESSLRSPGHKRSLNMTTLMLTSASRQPAIGRRDLFAIHSAADGGKHVQTS